MAINKGTVLFKGKQYGKYEIEAGDSLSSIVEQAGFKGGGKSWRAVYDLDVNREFRVRFPDPNKISTDKNHAFFVPKVEAVAVAPAAALKRQIVITTTHAAASIAGEWAEIKATLSKKVSSGEVLFHKLAEVKWEGIVKKTGLRGDWHYLWLVWFFELTPQDLGLWSEDNSLVTITSGGYIEDLKAKPHNKAVLAMFKQQHPKLSAVQIGSYVHDAKGKKGVMFVFNGPGTATGLYDAVEWFLGSYLTTVEVIGIDRGRDVVKVKVTVFNDSHWESGTRVPQVGQNFGLPKYLVADSKRKDLGPGGDFRQKFVWYQEIQY